MIRSINRIHLVGLAGSVAYTVLALYSRTPAGPSLVVFYGCVGAAALGLWVVWRWAKTVSVTWPMVFTWALLFRAIGLFGDPIFEDDFYRYLWDGYRTATVSDPYGVAPEAFFADPAIPARFQTILGQINYPEVPTIYGPVLQWLFALGYVIAPGEVWPLKLLLCLADVALLRLLARLAPPGQVLLYAWNPLVIKEIAFTAHSDGLMPLFLIAAWFCTRAHQPLRAAGLLAIAVAVKLPALLLLPFLLRWKSWKSVAVFGITLAGLYLPLVPRGASDWAGLKVFASHWEFNPALFGLLTLTVDPSLARWLLAGTVLSCVAALFLRSRGSAQQGALPRGDLILGALVLCSPVINPWYWLWVLPFSVVYPSRWSWTAAIALLAAYVTGLNLNGVDLGAYEQPLWVRWIEFGAIAVAGAADVLKPKLDRKWAGEQIRSRRLEEGPRAGGPAALDSTLSCLAPTLRSLPMYRIMLLLFLLVPSWANAAFDHRHAAWDALLKKHVRLINGGVASQLDYSGVQRDHAALKAYTDALGQVSQTEFDGWSKDQQLAFLINAYNAYTVELVLSAYPKLKSIRDLGGLFGSPWKKQFFKLFGQPAHLDHIEHDLIRAPGRYAEPRIHFAVVCASIGCPDLREEAFVAGKLDTQLEDAMRRFLSDRSRNRYNATKDRLEVSKIFDWYSEDFERGDKGFTSVSQALGRYAGQLADDPQAYERIRSGQVEIDFLDYDWSLNDIRAKR